MRKSEVFENFLKIAEEKGMIPLDAPDKAKKKLENDPRADSLSVSDIEALYGVKPDLPKSMEYERNIMERAHPNSLIISPSHDKINGLIENENERQNISLNVVYKMPDGQLMNPKYAQQEMVLSLVRLANELDNKDKEELRVLADTCLHQVAAKQLKKVAILPLAAGIAAAIGALYVQQHMSFINEGLEKNHQKLITEIDDLLQSSSSWGVGTDYTQQFKQMVQDLRDKLTNFYDLYKKIEPLIVDLEKPRTAKELIQLAQQPETDTVIKAYKVFRMTADNMMPYLDGVKKDFASETFKVRQVQDKGFFTSLLDKTQVLHGGKGLVADDFDDVVRAIDPYEKSIGDTLTVLKNAESLEKSAQRQIQQAATKSQKELGDDAENVVTSPTSKSVVPSGAKEVDQQVEGLGRDLEEEFPELT